MVRLPPVRKVKPSDEVSAMIGRTFSYGMPSVSAAIAHIDAREPPMSGLPSTSVTVPSFCAFSVAQLGPPACIQ